MNVERFRIFTKINKVCSILCWTTYSGACKMQIVACDQLHNIYAFELLAAKGEI